MIIINSLLGILLGLILEMISFSLFVFSLIAIYSIAGRRKSNEREVD